MRLRTLSVLAVAAVGLLVMGQAQLPPNVADGFLAGLRGFLCTTNSSTPCIFGSSATSGMAFEFDDVYPLAWVSRDGKLVLDGGSSGQCSLYVTSGPSLSSTCAFDAGASASASYLDISGALTVSTGAGNDIAGLVAPSLLTCKSACYSATTTGSNGGGTTMTLGLYDNGTYTGGAITVACSLGGGGVVACDTTCDGGLAVVASGHKATIEVVANGCSTQPKGTFNFVVGM